MKTAKQIANEYRGTVTDRMTGVVVRRTKGYTTWEQAQHAAETACNRHYGRHNDRYAVDVE